MELQGKRVAILAEDLYEDIELWYPFYRMLEAGAAVTVLGTGKAVYQGKHGITIHSEREASAAAAAEFDAVIVPGGYAPDRLRRHGGSLDLVREMWDQGKLVAMICHAGWVAISAGIVRGRRLTSFFSIRDDLENAGAHRLDQEVVRDGQLISSRSPADLPAFCRSIIDALARREAERTP